MGQLAGGKRSHPQMTFWGLIIGMTASKWESPDFCSPPVQPAGQWRKSPNNRTHFPGRAQSRTAPTCPGRHCATYTGHAQPAMHGTCPSKWAACDGLHKVHAPSHGGHLPGQWLSNAAAYHSTCSPRQTLSKAASNPAFHFLAFLWRQAAQEGKRV